METEELGKAKWDVKRLKLKLKVYLCCDHDGHFPVGVCSLVVAKDEEQARELLDIELKKQHLDTDGYTLSEVDTSKASAEILLNGDC